MTSNNEAITAAVVGAGSFGTALAHLLATAGHQVGLWAYEPEVAQAINAEHRNPYFLPEIPLHPGVIASSDLAQVLPQANLVVLVMPSHVFRQVLEQAAPHMSPEAVPVSCSKGIEDQTCFTMVEVAEDVLPKSYHRRLCCLSGPSFAKEVVQDVPTVVTVASRNLDRAKWVQHAFATPSFRVYSSPDLEGVELGGAIKNPLAIAAGMVAGMGAGTNTLAALVTRGLAEMTRLALARGGQLATMAGLAGLGDLVLTCYGGLSRNRTVGVRLAQGETIEEITQSMRMVAEGVRNTLTVLELARRAEVVMPITEAVRQVIYEHRQPAEVLHELMTRGLKTETE